jgi:hypothetical protein
LWGWASEACVSTDKAGLGRGWPAGPNDGRWLSAQKGLSSPRPRAAHKARVRYVVQLRTCSPCLALKNCAGVGGWGLALCVVSASAAAVAAALCWLLVATGDALAGAAFCATSPAAHTGAGEDNGITDVGESQSVFIMINPIIFPRTRIHIDHGGSGPKALAEPAAMSSRHGDALGVKAKRQVQAVRLAILLQRWMPAECGIYTVSQRRCAARPSSWLHRGRGRQARFSTEILRQRFQTR